MRYPKPSEVSPEAFLQTKLALTMRFDMTRRCPCGCGVPAVREKCDIKIGKIGPVFAALLMGAAARVLRQQMVKVMETMTEDESREFAEVANKESVRD